MADPEILGINAKYIDGEKRRRVRKKAAKIPLPEPVIALLKDGAKEKYLASLAPIMEADEGSSLPTQPSSSSSIPSEQPGTSGTAIPDPLPGTSGTNQIDLAESDDEDDEENNIGLDPVSLQQFFDDQVIVNPPSDEDEDDDIPRSGRKRPAIADDEEMDTSKKSKKNMRFVIDDSDEEMENN